MAGYVGPLNGAVEFRFNFRAFSPSHTGSGLRYVETSNITPQRSSCSLLVFLRSFIGFFIFRFESDFLSLFPFLKRSRP